ncbi:MAG: hypothetical protein JW740_00275 [Candidatus Zambryskibacteria bacterium]|nr:hypothetical protein [Candidatus Zambryskibacteria bacterium]
MSNVFKFGLILLAIIIGYLFAYPTVQDVFATLEDKQDYENSLSVAQNIEIKKQELLDELNKISNEDKEKIDTILPKSLDFVRLVSQIADVAARYGISIGGISLIEVQTSQNLNSEDESIVQNNYKSAIIGFSFDTSHQNFNYFILDLEKSLRLLDIKSMKLNTTNKGINSYDVEFETYWFD